VLPVAAALLGDRIVRVRSGSGPVLPPFYTPLAHDDDAIARVPEIGSPIPAVILDLVAVRRLVEQDGLVEIFE
jgi:hypothetical protein